MKTYMSVIISMSAVLVSAGSGVAQTPGQHPAYLHAIQDLKHAKAAIVARGGDAAMKGTEKAAIDDIVNATWGLYAKLSPDDKKDTRSLPSADIDPSAVIGGLHEARDYLIKAKADCSEAESDKAALSDRGKVVELIEAALIQVNNGINDYNTHK